jgi:hypothetical protein
MSEVVVRAVERIGRAPFLAKLGAATAGLAAAGVAFPETSAAWACCNLCFPPTSNCSNCACAWCWTCENPGVHRGWACCECHTNTSNCGGNCVNVKCSYVFVAY